MSEKSSVVPREMRPIRIFHGILHGIVITQTLILFLGLVQIAGAQPAGQSTAAGIQQQPSNITPIPGCMVLHDEEIKLQAYISAHPEVLKAKSLQKRAVWGFSVGSTHSWWATNLNPSSPNYYKEYSVPSTCKAVGTNAYIFVEDSLWAHGKVNQAAVDSVRDAFDLRTPANASKGIYQTDVETFGDPPDVDGDPRIIILILDIIDGFSGSGGYIAGYFYSINEYPDVSLPPGRHSNYAEIYYVDGDPQDLTIPYYLTNAMSTTAHEFQHMIHWAYDPNEITFINESCSTGAELVCGYPYNSQNLYTNNTDIYLLGWSSTLADYSRAARWCLYLWNQFPNGYLKLLVANTSIDTTGINNALALYTPSTSRRFSDIFQDWTVANSLNDVSYNSRYGYTYAGSLTKPTGVTVSSSSYSSGSVSVNKDAVDYYTFSTGANLTATFTSSDTKLLVRAIEVGAASKTVVNVPLNSAWNEPAFGSTYTTITFAVTNYSGSATANYSLSSTYLTGPPSAPTLLSPTNGAGSISVNPTLSWNAASGATAYQLQVSKSVGFGTTVFDDSTIVTTSKLVGTLGNDTTYYWRVRAKNSFGWSSYSSAWNFTTIAIPPSAPVLLTPTDASTGISVTPTLSWNASAGATTYQLQVSKSAGFGTTVFDDSTITATSKLVGPLGSDTTYYWRVRAKNTGGWSSYSSTWSFTTSAAVPSAPVLLAPANASTGISVTPTLSWNAASGATAYQLQVSKSVGFGTLVFDDSTIAITSKLVGTLGNDTTYYWRVRAKNATGWSSYSTTWNFTTIVAAPSAPVLLAPANTSTGISVTPTLSWNASAGATTYQLQVSKSAGFSTTVFDDSTITTTSKLVGSLGNDTTYYWRVRAKNTGGWSSYSSTWSFTTSAALPSAPVLLAPANTSTGISVTPTLSWNASSGATAYQLQVSKSAGFGTLVFDDSTIVTTSRLVGTLGNDTTYYWRVRAKNAAGWSSYSTTWNFTTIVAAPSAPVLLAPANASTGISVTPTLSWNASTGATTYQLQVSKSAGFGTLVFDDSTIATTSKLVGSLGNDTTYYWRVRAKNAAGWSSYSITWNFTTIVAAPSAPVLLAPANASIDISVTPTLSWNASTGATTYQLQVSKSAGFGTLMFDDSTIATTSKLVGSLGNDTTYYWRVRAKNAAGWSSYSITWNFTTIVAAPSAPVLLAPTDASTGISVTPTLSWNASAGATTYQLQVSKSAGFGTLVFDDSTITTTSKLVGLLGNDTTYYWRVRAKNSTGSSAYSSVWSFTTQSATSIQHTGNDIPREYRLGQNYPNPFNPSTTITIELPEEATVTLEIYDMLGRKVRTLLDADKSAGYYNTVWDAKDDMGREVSSGIYIYHFKATSASDVVKSFIKSGKLVLTK